MTGAPLHAVTAFHLAFLLLVVLIFPKPRLYTYSVLAVLLALGFWVKFVLLTALHHPLNEPVGSFSGAPAEWSRALAFATAGALGTAFARIVHLIRAPRAKPDRIETASPAWYRRNRAGVWILTVLMIVGAVAWNLHASVYQTGLHPRVILPGHANVAIGWFLVLGAPLWIALLLGWERFSLHDRAGWLWIPMAEGVISGTSMLSRAVYLFRMLPYVLVSLEDRDLATNRGRRNAALFSIAGISLFAISLVGVSWLRLARYPVPVVQAAPPEVGGTTRPQSGLPAVGGESAARRRRFMFREVIGLVTDRWIGLEGVFAVAAFPNLGMPLFREALLEDPNRGALSIYQHVTGYTYKSRPGVTFLTLPGIVAVFAYSGFLLVVFLGMAGVTAIALATELLADRLVASPLVCAVAGTGLACTLCQMNYPYLMGLYFLELWSTLFVFALLRRSLRGAG